MNNGGNILIVESYVPKLSLYHDSIIFKIHKVNLGKFYSLLDARLRYSL